MCGKADERLFKTQIEGVELNVCHNCSKFGKIISQIRKPAKGPQKKKIPEAAEEEKIELLAENYADLIKKKRESMGLSQKDFSIKINEKEATMHKIETGTLNPSIALARKLEKFLGIMLIEEHLETREKFRKSKEDGFTIGDFIKLDK